jgi:hypothetical protein
VERKEGEINVTCLASNILFLGPMHCVACKSLHFLTLYVTEQRRGEMTHRSFTFHSSAGPLNSCYVMFHKPTKCTFIDTILYSY